MLLGDILKKLLQVETTKDKVSQIILILDRYYAQFKMLSHTQIVLSLNNPTLTIEEWSYLTFTIAIAIILGHTTLLIGSVLPILAIVLIAVILISHNLVICRSQGLAGSWVGGGGVHLLYWLGGRGGEDYWGLLGLRLDWHIFLDVIIYMVGVV